MQDYKIVQRANKIIDAVNSWNKHSTRTARIVRERRGGIHIAYYGEHSGRWRVVHTQDVTQIVSDLIPRRVLPLGGIGNYSTKRVPH